MFKNFRSCVSSAVALSLILSTPGPLFASTPSPPAAPTKIEVKISPEELAQMSQDQQLLYWGQLQEEHPLMAEFALSGPGNEQPVWKVEHGNALLDQEPFFIASQRWTGSSQNIDCEAGQICFLKDAQGLNFTFKGRILNLAQPLTPFLETDKYIFMTADDLSLFQAKMPGESDPGEGFFFINKADFAKAAKFNTGLPVFYFPLPGPGWTGPNDYAFENDLTEQVVIYNQDHFGLPVDLSDIATMEHLQNQNLILAQTWSALEKQVAANGVALPRPETTMVFGMFLSGQLPQPKSDFAANTSALKVLKQIAARASSIALPQANALRVEPSLLQRIQNAYKLRSQQLELERVSSAGEQLELPMSMPRGQRLAEPTVVGRVANWMKGIFARSKVASQERQLKKASPELDLKAPKKAVDPDELPMWRRWLTPGILYGTYFGAAAMAANQIDWSHLITADMPTRIMNAAAIFGTVLGASIALKYSIHKARFDQKYPKTPDETILSRINKEHKGILDEFTHALWVAASGLPQGIRHVLDFMKDRFFPSNKMVHSAWEYTMGFQMKASSRLAMNAKTFYLGSIVYGMADSISVAVDMLIFGPLIMHYFGWALSGETTAAFISATVLSQFILYLREGAHSYSADVKSIHLESADAEAARIMRSSGLDADAPKNEGMRQKLTAIEIEKRFKMVGLPGEDEFLYDPVTIMESMIRKSGYGLPAELSTADRKKLAGGDFLLKRRHVGKVKPALKLALQAAREIQASSPSELGDHVIQTLEWATNARGLSTAIAGRTFDTTFKSWGHSQLADAMQEAVVKDLKTERNPTGFKAMKSAVRGAFNYLVKDSTAEARDIRSAIYEISTSGSLFDVAPYFPERWKKMAGSEEASILSAELIHSALFSLLEFDEDKIQPTSSLDEEYGSRVQKIMARIDRRDPNLLRDPFARQVRYRELMVRLRDKDKARQAVMGYQPVASVEDKVGLGTAIPLAFERMQWDIAREIAAEKFSDPVDAEEQVESEWLGMANQFRQKTDDGSQSEFDTKAWARSYKYRTVVAQEISKRVSLYVDDPAQSKLVRSVIVKSAIATEKQLATTTEHFYANSLDEEDRRFYEAEVFSRHFISTYIDTAVRSDVKTGEGVRATSPEFPGRFQKLRRSLFGRPGGKILSTGLRMFESMFRNEEASYSPTLSGWMNRNVPIFPDMYHNWKRYLRFMPFAFLVGWPLAYTVWQIHIPLVMYIVTFNIAFINPTMVEINSRLMRNLDRKPMEDVPSKLLYAFMHSRLTNPQAVVEAAMAESIVGAVDSHIVEPIGNFVEKCEDLLRNPPMLPKPGP